MNLQQVYEVIQMGWHGLIPLWREIYKNWQTLSALAVSIIVAFISWLQWTAANKQAKTAEKQWQTAEKQAQTARNQLRLSLFERRFAIYEALMRMVFIATSKADITHEQRIECTNETKGVEFLFNKDIDDYCRLLHGQAVEFHVQSNLMRQGQDSESDEAKWRQNDHLERVQWWFEQEKELPRRFAPFLRLEE
jgi:hypothetical protein